MASTTAAMRIVQVLEFASARAPELQALHELAHRDEMRTPADAKLASQRNQRRRRANAFKSHRMPQRLRQKRGTQPLEAKEEELMVLGQRDSSSVVTTVNTGKTDAPVPSDKQRCRKHERRPHVLAAERSWQAVRSKAAASHANAPDATTSASAPPAVWLATHVWHSKRMKMVEKYGHVLPAHRADKSISASLEAVRSKATLHDMSATGVLELYGRPQRILEALQLVSDPGGSDFHGMRFLAGTDEGESMLYHEGTFPRGAICPVTFQWRPLASDTRDAGDNRDAFALHPDWQNTKRQLWLWVHPAAFMEAAAAIASACQAVVDDDDDDADENDVIQVLDRRGAVCRFKLRGARANAMLAAVVGSADDELTTQSLRQPSDDGTDSDHNDGFDALATVQQCTQTNLSLLRQRLATRSDQQAAPGRVYAVAVADPRARRSSSSSSLSSSLRSTTDAMSLLREPTPREMAREDAIRCPVSHVVLTAPGSTEEEPATELVLEQLAAILNWTTAPRAADAGVLAYPYVSPLDVADSNVNNDVEMLAAAAGNGDDRNDTATAVHSGVPTSFLWSQSKRALLHNSFTKDHALNAATFRTRQAQTLDSTASSRAAPFKASLPPPEQEALRKLHLMVIDKPGTFKHTGGYDIVVTPSYAPALLKALVFAGVLVVGMDEDDALATVIEQPSFPRDFPDTQAGRSYWQSEADARTTEHLRKPKAKRFAFEKHGIKSPFQPQWSLLFDRTGRSAAEDTAMDAAMDADDASEGDSAMCVLRGAAYMAPFCFAQASTASSSTAAVIEKIPVAIPTLVRVVLRVPGRASLVVNAMLYAPTRDDMDCYYAQKNWRGRDIALLDKADERLLVGFVTSVVYDRPKGAFRASGFCACEPLQDVYLHERMVRSASSREALVMLRTPQAKMLRPVLVHTDAVW